VQESSAKLRYSVSLVTQGEHRFYTLTMPSDVLARTCFVTNRYEDPRQGFQRVLDTDRAQQIAEYVDTGFGSIPNSIVLSAQPEAELKVIGRGKTLEFSDTQKAFLVLDGQHRVYGFSLAKTTLRVPVVIYNNLSRQDETRLFIDINTKQRPVPNELLLDIKRLADYETDTEKLLSVVFDLFAERNDSPLLGQLSAATRASGKISRVTFNTALKPLMPIFSNNDSEYIYVALRSYLAAFVECASEKDLKPNLTNTTTFRAVLMLFPEVARRVKDRFGSEYGQSNFAEAMAPMFDVLRTNTFKAPGNSPKNLAEALLKALQTDFRL
jgi:DGQHR domain-containing protein